MHGHTHQPLSSFSLYHRSCPFSLSGARRGVLWTIFDTSNWWKGFKVACIVIPPVLVWHRPCTSLIVYKITCHIHNKFNLPPALTTFIAHNISSDRFTVSAGPFTPIKSSHLSVAFINCSFARCRKMLLFVSLQQLHWCHTPHKWSGRLHVLNTREPKWICVDSPIFSVHENWNQRFRMRPALHHLSIIVNCLVLSQLPSEARALWFQEQTILIQAASQTPFEA